MGMRFYDVEDWVGTWRWYHWLLLLALLWLFGWGSHRMGWIEGPPPEGWHPKTEAPAASR